MKQRMRASLAMFLALVMMLTLIPSTGVMAAEPNGSGIEVANTEVSSINAKVPSLRSLFSATYYSEHNPDVKAAYGDNENLLYRHYLYYGLKEGRDISPILDLRAYRAGNPDLDAAFGDDWKAYVVHFLQYGIFENAAGQRSSKGIKFNPVKFLNEHPEAWRTTGGDLIKVVEYYIDQGMPVGSWVNTPEDEQRTVQSDNSSSTSNSSTSGTTPDNGGGSTKPTVPTEPGVSDNDPVKPVDPVEPIEPVEPVDPVVPEHEHTRGSFDADGNCKVEGCDYTLADLQKACKLPHSAIAIGQTCPGCGAPGTKEPEEEHTRDSVHDKNTFDENGDCMLGCDLTLAEFQESCPDKDNHSNIPFTEKCEVCGASGTKVETPVDPPKHEHSWAAVWTNDADAHWHECEAADCDVVANADKDGYAVHTFGEWDVTKEPTTEDVGSKIRTCTVCSYEETEEIPKLEVTDPEPPQHTADSEHTKESFDDNGSCKEGCNLTLEAFQNACQSEEHETLKATGGECSVCGKVIEQEEKPFVCPKADSHDALHDGVACDGEGCDYVGEAEHNFEDGACIGCDATCTPETCPEKENHANILTTAKCDVCGGAGTKVEEPIPPAHTKESDHVLADFEDGVCKENCGLTLAEFQQNCTEHNDLHQGQICTNCGTEGTVEHKFENGSCACGATCTEETCPNKDNHAAVACSEGCGICPYIAPAHSYNSGNPECIRCGKECTHNFGDDGNGSECAWCHMHNNAYCNSDFHDHCNADPNAHCPNDWCERPAADHSWNAETGSCRDCGAACPNTDNHVEGEACGTCGHTKPQSEPSCTDESHAQLACGAQCDKCDFVGEHNYGDDGECTKCHLVKPTEGESSGQDDSDDPTNNGNSGTGGGSNTDNADGIPATQSLPDALPVEPVSGVPDTIPDPDSEPKGNHDEFDDDPEEEDEEPELENADSAADEADNVGE